MILDPGTDVVDLVVTGTVADSSDVRAGKNWITESPPDVLGSEMNDGELVVQGVIATDNTRAGDGELGAGTAVDVFNVKPNDGMLAHPTATGTVDSETRKQVARRIAMRSRGASRGSS